MSLSGSELWPYFALVLFGFLPNEVWRWLGVILARGVDEDSEIFLWVRGVATAVLAGVIAKLTLFPPGALATVPTALRVGAVMAGLTAFLLIRRSVFAGVAVGELVLIGGSLLTR